MTGRLPTAEVVALMTGADPDEARRIGFISESTERERERVAEGVIRDGPDQPERC